MDLLEELKNLSAKLNQAGIDYALCGGLALAIYARPRATLDIDIMVDSGSLSQTKQAAKELGFIILKACQMIEKALTVLEKQPKQIFDCCVEINSLENEANRVRADAISRLFVEEKDPIRLIKWKEVYENLELITDKCEDTANILESVVVKNA